MVHDVTFDLHDVISVNTWPIFVKLRPKWPHCDTEHFGLYSDTIGQVISEIFNKTSPVTWRDVAMMFCVDLGNFDHDLHVEELVCRLRKAFVFCRAGSQLSSGVKTVFLASLGAELWPETCFQDFWWPWPWPLEFWLNERRNVPLDMILTTKWPWLGKSAFELFAAVGQWTILLISPFVVLHDFEGA